MLGRYELLLPIASGGMGNVWAARLKGTRGFRKLVAIKTVLRAVEDERFEEMLYHEATLASQLHHPNIVETLELGDNDGSLYLVMELVHGESLGFILREALSKGGIPLNVAVSLIGQVCRGLDAAHELRDEFGQRVGLVHRDISPPNVLVTYTGTVKIVDFGVATTASSETCGSGEIKGKISYLAPEQLRGEEVDARVDVFATGILLYLMTVGRHPFRASGEAGTISRILSDLPAALPSSLIEDYPAELEAVLMRALEKRRERRFPSAAAFLDALEQAMPSAFGPEGEKAVVSFIHSLLGERMAERRATLRMAEELSERQSHDAVSLPAVAAPSLRPSPPARKTRAVLALGMAVLMLGGAAAAARGRFLASSAEPEDRAPAASPLVKPVVRRGVASAVVASPPAAVSATPAPAEPSARPAPIAHATRPLRRHHEEADSEPAPAPAPEAVTEPELAPPEPESIAPVPEPAPLIATTAPLSASAQLLTTPLVPPIPSAVRPEGPRQLSSRIGHERLLSNPKADANRLRLPPGLERSGTRFSATLKMCVSPLGKVASVTVLRSAGSALDQQLTGILSRWRYRPLLEGGRAVPFCYVLNYEIGQ